MAGRSIPPETRQRYVYLRTQRGNSRGQAAKAVGVHYDTAKIWDGKAGIHGLQRPFVPINDPRTASGEDSANTAQEQVAEYGSEEVPEPVPLQFLAPEAARGLEDIAYFARRYFGAVLLPFHVQMVDEIKRRLETPWEEYLLENIAPGAGKSFFKRIVGAWLTCQDRTLRGLMGSATQTLATKDTDALRTALERTTPARAPLQAKRHGITLDAVACLAMDYGRFKPNSDEPNIWRADGFRVAQIGGQAVSDKDLTWLAVGFDTKYIGTRVNIAAWDDPHDRARMRTLEGREKMQEDWSDVAEARLETGGLLWVIQQRLGPGDLTSFCMEQRTEDEENEGEDRPVYHQIRFRAHYEDLCRPEEGVPTRDWACHASNAPAWPDGCLLFPKKLHWRKLAKESRKPSFPVVYQQEDVDPAEALVKAVWVSGGRDPDTGEEHVGCWDLDRGTCELPKDLKPPWLSFVSIDPSPSQFWAIQWWVYHPATELRILMDLERRRMSADELIDRVLPSGDFTGLMPAWQERSKSIAPIQYWIYERNAAQRFILKFNLVQDWQRKEGVAIISHDTHAANKNAPEEAYGVRCVGPHWRYGRVRLPGRQDCRHVPLKLVTEVLAWPNGTYDDNVMAEWIGEWNIPRLNRSTAPMPTATRPDWVSRLGVFKVPA